jgi:multidrug efflux system outer membrane protein
MTLRVSRGGRLGRAALVALLLGTVAACSSVGPDYEPPKAELPDLWEQSLSRGLAEGRADLRTWWTLLDDPVLDGLITRAGAGNLDLKSAFSRVRQARAQLGIAAGERFPGVDGAGSVEHGRPSEEISPVLPSTQSRNDTLWSVGLDSSWEIDVWGRIRRNIESADATIGAAIEDYRDTLVLLYSDLAGSYVQARTFQARLASALQNVDTQRGALQLTIDRNQAGLAPDLDVRQAELNLATTEAAVPSLRSGVAQSINRIAVLVGAYPSAVRAELEVVAPIPKAPEEVIIGLPTELLRQRPDIRSAERVLAAQTAQIGVATADLYPRFSLSGTFAFEAFGVSDLFSSDAISYGIGPAFRWNLFNAGRVRSNIDLQNERSAQALIAYEQSVLLAVEEVNSSMTAYVEEQARREALRRAVTAARASVDLVLTLYRTGLTDFQNVLDTQRSQFEREDDLWSSQGQVVQNLISVYKSLGGGWAPATETVPASAPAASPDAQAVAAS